VLADTIQELVEPDWKSDHDPIYRIYDKYEPHCDRAEAYKEVTGRIRYRCVHILTPLEPTNVRTERL
jgi:hypothetical protein